MRIACFAVTFSPTWDRFTTLLCHALEYLADRGYASPMFAPYARQLDGIARAHAGSWRREATLSDLPGGYARLLEGGAVFDSSLSSPGSLLCSTKF